MTAANPVEPMIAGLERRRQRRSIGLPDRSGRGGGSRLMSRTGEVLGAPPPIGCHPGGLSACCFLRP